jgi:IS605 OrfB family transposase
MALVVRTEIMEVGRYSSLSLLCHQTKNPYNRANYIFKQKRKDMIFLSYYDLNSILKSEECYKLLPVHTAQHTIKLLIRNWKAYCLSVKEWKRDSKKFLGFPRSPRYKPKKGECIAIFSNQQARIINGWLVLPKKVDFTLRTRLNNNHKIREVRVIPRGVGYTVEVVYLKQIPKTTKKNPIKRGALDLGLKNLVTFVDNIGSNPIIIKDEGKGVKSITQFYLKKIKEIQEKYSQQQRKNLIQKNKLSYGQAYYRIREKWRRKVKDYFHKISRYLIDLWVERNLHTIVIGYNPHWKQNVRLRKKTTQLFVLIPFYHLIRLLRYKAEEQGITIELIDESYTSKCSFLDNEEIYEHSSYMGKRVKRGLFKSAHGIYINSDVNAAYNILLKSDPQALPLRSVGGVGGYVVYPLRISFQSLKF